MTGSSHGRDRSVGKEFARSDKGGKLPARKQHRTQKSRRPSNPEPDLPESHPPSPQTTNMPLIGKVPQIEGAYVAAGHSVWGILNAPATGEALAELIAESVARTIDLTPFDPIRLRPLNPSLLRPG